jgi:uncharacterized Fe-S cluster-containing MiaB family protein
MDVLARRRAGCEWLRISRCFSAGYTRGRSGRLDQEESSLREKEVTRWRDR